MQVFKSFHEHRSSLGLPEPYITTQTTTKGAHVRDEVVLRHRRITRYQRRIVGTAAAIVAVLTLASGVIQKTNQPDAGAVSEQVNARNHFWNVVAGVEASNSAGPSDRLGDKLHDLVGKPKEAGQFVAQSFDFPGVSDQIGFDPFNHQGFSCDANCGHLSSYVQQALRTIDRGGVESLLTTAAAAKPDTSLTLTPFGVSFWFEGLLFWFVFGWGGALIALWLDQSGVNGDSYLYYTQLDWQLSSPGARSKFESFLYAPWLAAKIPASKRLQEQLLAENPVAGMIPQVRMQIEALKALPAPARTPDVRNLIAELEQKEEALLGFNQDRRRHYDAADGQDEVERARNLLENAQTAIDAYHDGDREIRRLRG